MWLVSAFLRDKMVARMKTTRIRAHVQFYFLLDLICWIITWSIAESLRNFLYASTCSFEMPQLRSLRHCEVFYHLRTDLNNIAARALCEHLERLRCRSVVGTGHALHRLSAESLIYLRYDLVNYLPKTWRFSLTDLWHF